MADSNGTRRSPSASPSSPSSFSSPASSSSSSAVNVRPLRSDSMSSESSSVQQQRQVAVKMGVHKSSGDDASSAYGFSEPFSADWCFSVIGSEYCHTYFWILKDLSWTQGWRLFSISFGSFAIMWWVIILYHALRTRNTAELWNATGLFLWLFANFWWMTGEAHDYAYPDSPAISERHLGESAIILETAVVWLSLYYFIVLPLNLLPQTAKAMEEYDDGEFVPRFSYFKYFRQYENIHTLFWLCKDLAWALNNISMWFVFLFPTVLVAVDLLWVALSGKDTSIDTAHFAAGLLWVLGNAVWALGEFFSDSDEPFKLWQFTSKEALTTARWYSSWILTCSFIPVAILYAIWIPLTIQGKIPAKLPPVRRIVVRKKRASTSRSSSKENLSYQQGATSTSTGSSLGDDPAESSFGSDRLRDRDLSEVEAAPLLGSN